MVDSCSSSPTDIVARSVGCSAGQEGVRKTRERVVELRFDPLRPSIVHSHAMRTIAREALHPRLQLESNPRFKAGSSSPYPSPPSSPSTPSPGPQSLL
jgi:hypothetical protein